MISIIMVIHKIRKHKDKRIFGIVSQNANGCLCGGHHIIVFLISSQAKEI